MGSMQVGDLVRISGVIHRHGNNNSGKNTQKQSLTSTACTTAVLAMYTHPTTCNVVAVVDAQKSPGVVTSGNVPALSTAAAATSKLHDRPHTQGHTYCPMATHSSNTS